MFSDNIGVPTRVPAVAIGDRVPADGKLRQPFCVPLKTFPRMPGNVDRADPGAANSPDHNRPLRTKAKREIYREYCRVASVQSLAQRFHQSQSRIHQISNEIRAARIMELPLNYVGGEDFAHLRAERMEEEILGPGPESDRPRKKRRLPGGLPAYLASLEEVPLLTWKQEVHLFRKMNYLKYRAGILREELDLDWPQSHLMDQIEKLYDGSVATRNQIVRANLRLVISIAKRYVGQAGDFFELVSDGNLWLIGAVEKFDVSRGFRFCTYATAAIMNNFSHTIPAVLRDRGRFLTSHADVLCDIECFRADPYVEETLRLRRELHVRRGLRCLDERELQIITQRFGLVRNQGPLTLKQLGDAMGVSKERIRQIEYLAIAKLRKAAEKLRADL